MRDKLIELIDNNKACDFEWECNECEYYDITPCFAGRMADALIANGVTFADVPETNVGKWIPVSERLPEDGEVVQIWCGEPQIARYKRGVSMAERDAMKRGELEDTEEIGWALSTGCMTHKRSGVFKACDEWGNNAVPYNWESTCGPMTWFGQDVTHWMPLPEPPKEGK